MGGAVKGVCFIEESFHEVFYWNYGRLSSI